MRLLHLRILLALLPACSAGATTPAATSVATATGYQVSSAVKFVAQNYDWQDTARQRTVPAKIYYPVEGKGPFPVILFSHGLGGSRENYSYLGEYWASHGYISVHVQHQGSDDAVWKGAANPKAALRRAARNTANAVDRPLDISFAFDQLEKLNRDSTSPLFNKIDLSHAGIAGHSFGAHTTLVIAGQTLPSFLTKSRSLADPRFKAAIAMSSPVPFRKNTFDDAYAHIAIPVLHLTGENDKMPITNSPASERRIPYDHTTHAPAWLVIFKDADHMTFSGQRLRGQPNPADDHLHLLIQEITTAYWDAELKDDSAARDWLAHSDGLAQLIANYGSAESKGPSVPKVATR